MTTKPEPAAEPQQCPKCEGHGAIEGKICDCACGQMLARDAKHVSVAYNHETGKKDVFIDNAHRAAEPRPSEPPKGSDICSCGDYRSQHVDGSGKCKVCDPRKHAWDGCQQFLFARQATLAEQDHWELHHGASRFIHASSAAAPPLRSELPVVCAHCHTLYDVAQNPAGAVKNCPKCGDTGVLVPALRSEEPLSKLIAGSVTLRVAELPNRTSPEDWPEAMLVTDTELRMIVQEEVEHEMNRIAALTSRTSSEPNFPAILEGERTKVCDAVNEIKKVLKGRNWLTEGRGPYSYDDDRWHSEFAAAIREIKQAIEPLERIASDLTNCPTKWEDVQKARASAEVRASAPSQCGNPEITVTYTNHKGVTAERRIIPQSIRFGFSKWHNESQWLMEVFDVGKGQLREFAMWDIKFSSASSRQAASPQGAVPNMIGHPLPPIGTVREIDYCTHGPSCPVCGALMVTKVWKCMSCGASTEPSEAASPAGEQARPKIVCLCGSTRFYKQFQIANFQETMKGNIVLSVGFYAHAQGHEWHVAEHGQHVGIDDAEKERLDELHKRKIDLADEVFVLNVGGYIGSSTRSEIDYAIAHAKPVRYLEASPGTAHQSQPPPQKEK